ncbi:MAG: tetratricopeptide repeat protein [Nitrospirae bacterium]|nr:tetratricopeptide repeat protein [Nitrospirota bacterium]
MKKPFSALIGLSLFLLLFPFQVYCQTGIDEDAMKEGRELLSKETELRKEVLGESLFGVFLGSKYVGLSSTKISEGTYEGKKTYRIEKALEMKMTPTTLFMKKTVYTPPDFSPLWSEFVSEQVSWQGTLKETIKQVIKDGELIIDEDKNGEITHRTLPIEKALISFTALEDIIYLLVDLNIPKKYGFDTISPENGQLGISYLKVDGKEEISLKDKSLPAYRLTLTSPDGDSVSYWIDESKKLIKVGMENVPLTIIAITEEEIGKDLSQRKDIPLEQRSPRQVVVDLFLAAGNRDEELLKNSIAFETMCAGNIGSDEEKATICEVRKALFLEKLLSGEIVSTVGELMGFMNEELLSEKITDDKAEVSFVGESTTLFELTKEQGAWKVIFEEPVETTASDLLSKGDSAYAGGDLDTAIESYSMAIKLQPEFISAYYNRGIAYYNKKLYDEAIKDFDKVIELNPENANAYIGRGNIYFIKADYNRAIPDYTKATGLDPSNVTAYNNLGYIYFDLKKYNDAVKHFQKTIKLNDQYADAYCGLAITYLKLGKLELARKNYKKAIKLDARYDGKIQELIEEGYFYTDLQLKAINELLKKLNR